MENKIFYSKRVPWDTTKFVKAIIRNDMKEGPCVYYSKHGVFHKMGDGFIKPLRVRSMTTLMRNWQTKPTFVELDEQLLVHGLKQDLWGQVPFMVDLKDLPRKWVDELL